jgi:hypothetical protein
LFAARKKRYNALMVAKLTVIFFIIACILMGIYLTILPWFSIYGISDWGDNYLLALVVEKTNMPILHKTVASGWVRGAVTGLGILNLFIAFWELAHFNRSVKMLEGKADGVK